VPTTQSDSVSASKTKSGFTEAIGFESTPPKRYLTATGSGIQAKQLGLLGLRLVTEAYTGSLTLDIDESPSGSAKSIAQESCDDTGGSYTCASTAVNCATPGILDANAIANLFANTAKAHSATEVYSTGYNCGDVLWITLSNEYTTSALVTNTNAALPAFPDTWGGTAGSYLATSADEETVAARKNRYRHRFPLPNNGLGSCFRATWVERFIPEAGVGIDSIDIISRGVYRPAVTATGGGGTGCLLVAVMSPGGGVSSVRVLNPGSGYTSAPTVAVAVGINGGTTSTGWTASLSDGRVVSVSGGSPGNYQPTFSLTFGGGSGASGTFDMDETGGLTSFTLTASGSGYTALPTSPVPSPTAKCAGATGGTIHLHLGTETEKCAEWDGTTLAGKWCVRDITGSGHALTSIEVVHGGIYLPTVSFSGGDGTGAAAYVSGFSTSGAVTAITVTSGGSGYTAPPTVTITRRGSGGSVTAATATASITGDAVSSVSVSTGGAYLPTLAITGGGGSGATATVAFDSGNLGKLATVSLTSAGSGFKQNPTLTLSYYGTETVLLAAHFGTETEYVDGAQPVGAIPLGYVPGVVRTYPVLGDTGTAPWKYYQLSVPSSDGTTLTDNLLGFCDCADCP
jgi:hypothetical protein